MYRQQKTIALLACTILAILLISFSIYSLNQVPSLDNLERPDIPFDLPKIDIPINPEQTSLQIPDLDIGDQDPEPLLRIDGQPNTQYLRLQTYDDYYSGTWDTALSQSVTYEGETLSLDVDLWTDYQTYNITITPLVDTMGYLPTPQNPIYLNLSSPTQFFTDQQIFQVPDVPGAYEIEYILYEYSDELMNASRVETLPQYLEVPDYLDSELKTLAEEITKDTTTDYEAIVALENYLETYYDYNLSAADPPPGVDPLEYFLFESGDGVCSHFNTALVMLARSLGYSARLVGGYYIDPLALVQEVYPIQSHAFTEI
ncbi:transglutaminase domain-containing protein, partial [Candidatus Bathyarchaeota archaeon]